MIYCAGRSGRQGFALHGLAACDVPLGTPRPLTVRAGSPDTHLAPLATIPHESSGLAEGRGRSGRDRLHHFRIAYGSALEAASHLELLAAAGVVDGERVRELLSLLDRVRALTWRLIHPRR